MVEKPQQRWTLRQRFESFCGGVNFESLLGLDLFSVLPTLLEFSCFLELIKKPGLLTLACLPLGSECLSSISPAFLDGWDWGSQLLLLASLWEFCLILAPKVPFYNFGKVGNYEQDWFGSKESKSKIWSKGMFIHIQDVTILRWLT